MKHKRVDLLMLIACFLTVAMAVLTSATGYAWADFISMALAIVVLVLTVLFVGWKVDGKGPLRPAILAAVCFGVIVSVAFDQWPLRISYTMSHRSLDALAKRIRSGEQIQTPQRVGLLVIRSVEISRHGIVCLWTDLDPGGFTGFVQCGPDHVPFNLWSIVKLDNEWQFIHED